jgi:hypothetical protein
MPWSSVAGRLGAPVVDPRAEVVTAVEDAAAETEAARAGAQVAPVAEGGDRGAEELGGFGDGEQFGVAAGGMVGHGGLRMSSDGLGPVTGEGVVSGLVVTPDYQNVQKIFSRSPAFM